MYIIISNYTKNNFLKEIFLLKHDTFAKLSRVFFTNNYIGYLTISEQIVIMLVLSFIFYLSVIISINSFYNKKKKINESELNEFQKYNMLDSRRDFMPIIFFIFTYLLCWSAFFVFKKFDYFVMYFLIISFINVLVLYISLNKTSEFFLYVYLLMYSIVIPVFFILFVLWFNKICFGFGYRNAIDFNDIHNLIFYDDYHT